MGEAKRRETAGVKFRQQKPTAAMQACRLAMVEAMRPYADEIGPVAMLACAAYTVGQLIAMQDQRTMTADAAMALVTENIKQGNAATVAPLMAVGGPKN